MDFQTWYRNADIPMKDENGLWFDAETGFPFKPVKKAKKAPAPKKDTKPLPGNGVILDTPEFTEARTTCIRHLGSQKMAHEKAISVGLNSDAIAAVETFIQKSETLLSSRNGGSLSGFKKLALENSDVSRKLNKALLDKQRSAV